MTKRIGGAGGGPRSNVGKNERILSVLGGAALTVLALRRKGLPGVALGTAGVGLMQRGLTGYCQVRHSLSIERFGGGELDEAGFRGTAHTAVNRPAQELYDVWRDFTTAPRFRESITEVEILDENTSRWTAAGPMGRTFQWTSRVVEDRPGEFIAWESIPPSDLPNRGSVRFTPFGRGAQAEVRYTLETDPPGGVVGEALLQLFHRAPQAMLESDLRNFREMMETGRTTTGGAR